MKRIDLNCDMGEESGNDATAINYVSSANIACGAHAGSLDVLKSTLQIAVNQEVATGAHPGYPDKENFGRIEIGLSDEDIVESVLFQLYDFEKSANDIGAKLQFIKLHGALYNRSAYDIKLMTKLASAIFREYGKLPIYTLAGSASERVIKESGCIPVREGFSDRNYNSDGTLVSRKFKNAVINNSEIVAKRAVDIALNNYVPGVPENIETICVHGDTKGAVAMAKRINGLFLREGIVIENIF